MSVINFHYEEVDFSIDEKKHIVWIEKIGQRHDVQIEELNYIFSTDDFLLNINREHLNHDYYTDIITFPYKEGKIISSDIFISVDRVEDNASIHGCTFEDELHRVMAHGLLHLIGFKDKTDEDIARMRDEEQQCINMFIDSTTSETI